LGRLPLVRIYILNTFDQKRLKLFFREVHIDLKSLAIQFEAVKCEFLNQDLAQDKAKGDEAHPDHWKLHSCENGFLKKQEVLAPAPLVPAVDHYHYHLHIAYHF
jgi:hypothetical protein